MPCNLYGPNDTFDLEKSHVLSAMVRPFEEARVAGASAVTLWGTGGARREFLHVRDLVSAVFHLMGRWLEPNFVNVGSGEDLTIRELADDVRRATGYGGSVGWDPAKPDGMPRKCWDVTRLRETGFVLATALPAGIRELVEEFRSRGGKPDRRREEGARP